MQITSWVNDVATQYAKDRKAYKTAQEALYTHCALSLSAKSAREIDSVQATASLSLWAMNTWISFQADEIHAACVDILRQAGIDMDPNQVEYPVAYFDDIGRLTCRVCAGKYKISISTEQLNNPEWVFGTPSCPFIKGLRAKK